MRAQRVKVVKVPLRSRLDKTTAFFCSTGLEIGFGSF